jgi:hypothetical protein
MSFGIPLELATVGTPLPGVDGSQLIFGALSADLVGRSKMAAGFFDTATLEDKLVAYSIPPDLIRQGIPVHVATMQIDAKVTGQTTIYTVPTGQSFVPLGIAVRCIAASAITVVAQADVRTSGAGDIMAQAAMTGLTAASLAWVSLFTSTALAIVAAGSVVQFSVDVAATGTSQTLQVDLFGYFVPTGPVMA